jgi:hypothetical protein
MESTAPASLFIALAFFAAVGAIFAGLVGPPIALPDFDVGLLTKTKGTLPSTGLRWIAATVLVSILLLTVAFWLLVKAITDDYAVRIAKEKAAALPPAAELALHPDKIACATAYYESQKFSIRSEFENGAGEKIKLMSKLAQGDDNLWRAEGALIYPNADSIRFSVAVIFGDATWSKGSATRVQRKGLRRLVKLETVLRQRELQDLSDKNDYVLTLGLASNRDDEDSETNTKLSFARAHNLGLAALRLKWKTADRIWPQAIGYAIDSAKNEQEEFSQRPAVIIGVIADRKVAVPDVTYGVMQLVPLDVVKLNHYSMSIREPREPRRISDRSRYLNADDIKLQPQEYQTRVLTKVRDSMVDC